MSPDYETLEGLYEIRGFLNGVDGDGSIKVLGARGMTEALIEKHKEIIRLRAKLPPENSQTVTVKKQDEVHVPQIDLGDK